jgi:hypothetical protein
VQERLQAYGDWAASDPGARFYRVQAAPVMRWDADYATLLAQLNLAALAYEAYYPAQTTSATSGSTTRYANREASVSR